MRSRSTPSTFDRWPPSTGHGSMDPDRDRPGSPGRLGHPHLRTDRPRTERRREQARTAAEVHPEHRRIRSGPRSRCPVAHHLVARGRPHALQRPGHLAGQHRRDDHRPGRQRAAGQRLPLRARGIGRDAGRDLLGQRRIRPVHHLLRSFRTPLPLRRNAASRAGESRSQSRNGRTDHHARRPHTGRHHAVRSEHRGRAKPHEGQGHSHRDH